jgi:hypothetical protein
VLFLLGLAMYGSINFSKNPSTAVRALWHLIRRCAFFSAHQLRPRRILPHNDLRNFRTEARPGEIARRFPHRYQSDLVNGRPAVVPAGFSSKVW